MHYNFLPKTLGGSKVHLLLGIKNTKIQPVLVKVLPSRVGVYLSPFKDVNGSMVIYAGPSKWFTKTGNDCNQESNYAIYSAFGTSIKNEPCSTDKYKEPRSESINKVEISPWVKTLELND